MKKKKPELKEWIITILITILCIFIIRTFIFSPVIVDGESMQPTLHNGDRLFINKIGQHFKELERFDVIVFQNSQHDYFIKRIIGLPGDNVEYSDKQLYVNGKKIKEKYITDFENQVDFSIESLYGYKKIPDGYYFVLGDNRPNSLDSRKRFIGLVSEDQILGDVNYVVWPFKQIGKISYASASSN